MSDETTQNDQPQPQPPAEAPVLEGVLVVREFQPDGGINTAIQLQGDVKPTEIQTILELGLQGWLDAIYPKSRKR